MFLASEKVPHLLEILQKNRWCLLPLPPKIHFPDSPFK